MKMLQKIMVKRMIDIVMITDYHMIYFVHNLNIMNHIPDFQDMILFHFDNFHSHIINLMYPFENNFDCNKDKHHLINMLFHLMS